MNIVFLFAMVMIVMFLCGWKMGKENFVKLNFKSYWMKNCQKNRRNNAVCCENCPFRKFIEREEDLHYLGL